MTIGMSNSELAVHKAVQQGATAAQIATIHSGRDSGKASTISGNDSAN